MVCIRARLSVIRLSNGHGLSPLDLPFSTVRRAQPLSFNIIVLREYCTKPGKNVTSLLKTTLIAKRLASCQYNAYKTTYKTIVQYNYFIFVLSKNAKTYRDFAVAYAMTWHLVCQKE